MKLYQSNRHRSILSNARPVILIMCRWTHGGSVSRCSYSAGGETGDSDSVLSAASACESAVSSKRVLCRR